MPKVSFGTFSMEAPADWTLGQIVFVGPIGVAAEGAAHLFQRNLTVTLESVSPEETAASFVRRTNEARLATGLFLQPLGEPEAVTLANGLHGVLTEHAAGQGAERVHHFQLVFIKNGIAHTAIATHMDGKPFELAREEFRRMLLSFE